MDSMMAVHDALVAWLSDGLLGASGWQVLLFAVLFTHATIASVTIYLHRAQAHRSVELHPLVSHPMRLWLWMTTGMVTREWVAIHRKHHAKCETADDPHSPVAHGIGTVLKRGSELYRAEAKVVETLDKYGHQTPDDWVERHVYSRFTWHGITLMLFINVALFGAIGLSVWALQMAWIPITAAGIINGLGHWWGYRNFEAPDASTNLSPWGILIGGEELHNNHHTYPTSAKMSVKPHEFDIGWLYIRSFEMLGLAKVRKTPPKMAFADIKPVADGGTLEAVIANRYEVMARYAAELKRAVALEMDRVRAQAGADSPAAAQLRVARAWLHRDDERIPSGARPSLEAALANSPLLRKLVAMREELRALWTRTGVSAEQLVLDLQAWCRKAEDSGIAALRDFSMKLRAAHA